MTRGTTRNEWAKTRGLRVWPVAALLGLAHAAVVAFVAATSPEFAEGGERAWNVLLNGLVQAATLASPVLIAVLASRQVDIEHTGGGWLLAATSGTGCGRLCRAKFVTLGVLVGGVTAAVSLLALVGGLAAIGPDASPPWTRWLVATLSVLIVTLVLLGLHILVAVRWENQLIGLGVALLGLVFAVFAAGLPAWAAHLAPWGYFALALPAEYVGTTLTAVPPGSGSVVALGVVAAGLFALATHALDRQEVTA